MVQSSRLGRTRPGGCAQKVKYGLGRVRSRDQGPGGGGRHQKIRPNSGLLAAGVWAMVTIEQELTMAESEFAAVTPGEMLNEELLAVANAAN